MQINKDFIEAIKRYTKAEAIFNVYPFMPSAEEELKQAQAHLDSFGGEEEVCPPDCKLPSYAHYLKESNGCIESKVYTKEDGSGSITSSTITG